MSDKVRHHTKQAAAYSLYNIADLIHEQWPELTQDEVYSYKTQFDKFCHAVQREYGISEEEIERCLELMRRETLYAA